MSNSRRDEEKVGVDVRDPDLVDRLRMVEGPRYCLEGVQNDVNSNKSARDVAADRRQLPVRVRAGGQVQKHLQ